jgi:hypothetical protein
MLYYTYYFSQAYMHIIEKDTIPANPSSTIQLNPIFMLAAEGFDVVAEGELPVPVGVLVLVPELDGDEATLLLLAASYG